ncbi:MAG: site-specific DNA-methyltransferase [Pseudolysinimonas sp.]
MVELVWDGKYDQAGNQVPPLRVTLPFQTIETVNESSSERQQAFDLFASDKPADWRNRLIWGDKKYVLPALLDEFSEKVDLVYIDPPFFTGDDFSFKISVEGDQFTKEPSLIEQKAYRDTWGTGIDGYLAWFYATLSQLHELLKPTGKIVVHLDWHVGHMAKMVLDEVFGRENFRNELIWYYYNKMPDTRNRMFPRSHDVLFFYTKDKDSAYTFNHQEELRDSPVKQLARKKLDGRMVNARDDDGNVIYNERAHRTVDDVWRISMLQPADKTQNVGYPTQKPDALLERVISSLSEPGDLVLDCFAGSGTTAVVAEKLGRRWIASDLGRFAIHTTRKRLLSDEHVRPFAVQNLGKYERQLWQEAEFGESAAARVSAYRSFILDLYRATPINGYTWLHGLKAGRMVHIGTVDSPVTVSDVQQILVEFRRAIGTGEGAPSAKIVDVLGWDFAFELNEIARQDALKAGVELRLVRIPREVLEKRAVEQGDIRFFELAALELSPAVEGQSLTLTLDNFIIPLDDVPVDVQAAVSHWSQWIDYWAIDWDNKADAFHNEWQTYRTRSSSSIELSASHAYDVAGDYSVVVKVIDILGNDSTKMLNLKVGP